MDPTLKSRKLRRLIHFFSHRWRRRIRISSRRLKRLIRILSHQNGTVSPEKIMKTMVTSLRTFFQLILNFFMSGWAFHKYDEGLPHLMVQNTLPIIIFCGGETWSRKRGRRIDPHPKVTTLSNFALITARGRVAAGWLKVRKNTRRGGWIVFGFSSFSPKLKYTDQKQFKNSFWSDVQSEVLTIQIRYRLLRL